MTGPEIRDTRDKTVTVTRADSGNPRQRRPGCPQASDTELELQV